MGEQAPAGGAGRAAGDARLDAGRYVAVLSLSGLAVYAITLALAGDGPRAIEPWSLGGAAGPAPASLGSSAFIKRFYRLRFMAT